MSEEERLFTPPGELYDPDEIMAEAMKHRPRKVFVLYSGGNDSAVLLDWLMKSKWKFDGVVHVNTLTGVCEDGVYLTSQFVRERCAELGLTLHELFPPETFEDLFLEKPIIDGLPGPGMHHIAYSRLKERALRIFVKQQKRRWKDRIMFLTGIREDESDNRMGYQSSIIDRVGAQVWVNPIYRWTNEEMHRYRLDHNLPQNPVSALIHMSGECLCGSFAKPGELEELRFWGFNDTVDRIEGWNRRAAELGLTYSTWGNDRPDGKDSQANMRLCQNCPGQMELFSDPLQ